METMSKEELRAGEAMLRCLKESFSNTRTKVWETIKELQGTIDENDAKVGFSWAIQVHIAGMIQSFFKGEAERAAQEILDRVRENNK